MAASAGFTSPYFRLEPVADGTWAAIITSEALALGNAAIVDLGGETLVVDSFVTPLAARDLKAAAVNLTGRAPRYLLNTHHHSDHVYGNQVFKPEAVVLATFRTRDWVAAHVDRVGPALERSREELRVLRERGQAGDSSAAAQADNLAARLDALDGLTIVPPEVCFERKLTLHGSRRHADILCFGGGHTGSDAFAWIPEERVLIAGDLVSVGSRHVWAGDGNPREWTRILEEMTLLGPERVIPGHGPVGKAEDVASFAGYTRKLAAVIERAIAEEASAAEIEALTPPEPHRENSAFFRRSAQALVAKALGRATQ